MSRPFCHVSLDLQTFTENCTLIAHPQENERLRFAPCEKQPFSDLEGCYLYYDQIHHKWIRSGKAVGSRSSNPRRTFGCRHQEHKKAAGEKGNMNQKSNFYSCYPDKSLTESNSRRKGYFNNLSQYCGIGFQRDGDTSGITEIEENKGIFTWSNDVIERVNKLNLSYCKDLEEKQLVMVDFLLELGYDLMINRNDNVSESPGFEPCVGIFGKEK